MSTKTEPFFSWLRQIPGDLYRLDEKPLLGFPPAFPWVNFSALLKESLQIKSLSIASQDLQWRAVEDLFAGLGDHLKSLSFSVNPLAGTLWWVMSEQALSKVMHFLLSKDATIFSETIDEGFYKAFYQFIAVETINAFEKVDFDKKLAPTLSNESTLPAEACLTLDVSISIGDETIYARLFLSQIFRKSWMQRYTQEQKTLALTSPLADTLNVIVHLEAGKVNLKPSEWKHLVPGDFVILDTCSIDPDEDKGRVMLVVNGFPFFRGKIKQGSLKILEHPLYHEVDTPMPVPPKKNETDAFDDSDLDDDFDLEDDESTHEDSSLDTDLDTDFTNDPTETDLSDVEDLRPTKENKKNSEKTENIATPPSTANPQAPFSIDEIPLTVVIEVGRIQMSVKKLLELQPGNMLDLEVHSESGVDMVINGRKIARGELLKIGDCLGIRIVELS